jgi:hypothetical protein
LSFVPCTMEAYSDTAALLLAMAAEAGHNIWAIETVTGGFEVPDDIAAQLLGGPVERTPPPGWDEPLPQADVEFVDGKYMLTADAVASRLADELVREHSLDEPSVAGREEIRAWAKDNGYDPAPQGKLKAAVIEAFRAANPDRATAG